MSNRRKTICLYMPVFVRYASAYMRRCAIYMRWIQKLLRMVVGVGDPAGNARLITPSSRLMTNEVNES
jgi:hypothetical protein